MSVLFNAGTAIQALGLAVAAGGMLALGAFTAPVLFKSFARPDAAVAMTVIFRRFDTLLLVAILMALAGEAMRFLAPNRPVSTGILPLVRYGLLALLTILSAVSIFSVNPRIESWQQAGETGTETFRKTHKLSETLYRAELFTAALLIVLTPFSAKTSHLP